MNKHSLYLVLLLFGLLVSACSVERNNPLSKAYHNTTAHYNGYFLAKEKMRLLEDGLQEKMQYDYNLPLPIYPPLDSSTAKAMEADLEDVVKKASFPIQYHKNSKWIDDSYILVGKVRYYQLNFAEAAQTFKYVNTNSPDRHARHEALVWLMRSFLQMEEFDNAWTVSELLKKERLNKANARELYLARSQYHTLLGDTAAVIQNLAFSLPNFDKKDDQSRTRFSLARYYQATEQNKEAYTQYNKILRRNPPYDLSFFSRLYLGQVTELSDSKDLSKIAGYFKKMLKDSKNAEYRDKIFYEMAQFELRQQNYDKALAHLQESLKAGGTLQNQKAYSYLLAGEIYFENLSKYSLAQAYYDSAVQVMPRTTASHNAVVERRDILSDFVTQYSTIQTQDSLQRIARMDEPERMAFLRQVVQQEEERRVQAEQRQQQRQQQLAQQDQQSTRRGSNQNNTSFTDNTTSSTGVWYFDNPTAMASARSEFQRRWGNRPLQDNWRLLNRSQGNEQAPVIAQQTEITPDTATAQEVNPEERLEAQVQTYLQNIPLTIVALQQSEKLVEEALFSLGNIYSQKLRDPEHAAETFEQLVQRFPVSAHTAEVYYSLYLIYDKAGDERKATYYAKLKQQFPNTAYAKLVDDPNFMSKNAADNVLAHALYDSAYTRYERHEYAEATQLVNQLLSQYTLSDIGDKAAFLNIMITARTEKPAVLRQQLQRFKTSHPTSPLQERADQLLATYNNLEQQNLLRQEAPGKPEPVKFGKPTASVSPEQSIISTEVATTTTVPPLTPVPATVPAQEQTTETPAVVEEAKPAAATASQEPAQQLVNEPATVATTPPAVAEAQPEVAAAAEANPLDYKAEEDSAYYFVLVYPSDAAAFKDIDEKYLKYNSTFYKAQNLTLDSFSFADNKSLLVLQSFSDFKTASAFNIKQKGPQAPVGKIRGVEFTTFVISSANYERFMQKKDLENYLNFFRTNY